jgi:hypothetical protein
MGSADGVILTGDASKSTSKKEEITIDPNDRVAQRLMEASDDDLKHFYESTEREINELSSTIFQMKQIKENWQKQNKWKEEDEKQLSQKQFEYNDMQEYLKKIKAEMERRKK